MGLEKRSWERGKVGADTCVRGNAASGNDSFQEVGECEALRYVILETPTHLRVGESSISHRAPEPIPGALKVSA